MKLSHFHRSVGEAMKALGHRRQSAARGTARMPAGERSEAAVRERLYGKRSPGR